MFDTPTLMPTRVHVWVLRAACFYPTPTFLGIASPGFGRCSIAWLVHWPAGWCVAPLASRARRRLCTGFLGIADCGGVCSSRIAVWVKVLGSCGRVVTGGMQRRTQQ